MGVVTWFRQHRLAADSMLATVLTVMAIVVVYAFQNSDLPLEEFEDFERVDHAIEWLLVAAAPMALALRRLRPIPSALFVMLSQAVIWGVGYPDFTLATIIALYSLVVHGRRPWGLRLAVAGGTLLSAFTLVGYLVGDAPAYVVPLVPLLVSGPIVLGQQTQNRQLELERLQRETLEVARRREIERRSAIDAERTRIARELHDVVAHGLSVMVVQAAAGRQVIDRDPAGAKRSLELVEQSGRESLAEMRRVLGLLREDDDVDPDRTGSSDERWAPSPGLEQIGGLVADLEGLGHRVRFDQHGTAAPLPAVVATSAYRIVQEATTNIIKHAGPSLNVSIGIEHRDPGLVITVTDDGRGAAAATTDGHGLTGMNERAEILGGTLRAGPRIGGGFEVVASIPTATELDAPATGSPTTGTPA